MENGQVVDNLPAKRSSFMAMLRYHRVPRIKPTHMLHGIFPDICPKNQPHVGQYPIDGAYGLQQDVEKPWFPVGKNCGRRGHGTGRAVDLCWARGWA